ncbi:MAG: Gfo/Idh/MocA family protein [Pyrinomonadaceae bacterium]
MEKKVGVGFIGTGFARKVQMPAFAGCEGAELVSVASGSEENARSAAAEFGIGHCTSDWRETIARDDVDLVCITTPPSLHKEMTLAAFEHGKHVLCEKPMAMNVAEAEEMVSAAKGKGLLALIDFELRFQPGRQIAREMIRRGEIGLIRHVKWNFRAPHRGNPEIPWNWWSDAEQGGGALGAINSHVIDSFNWFLDTEVSSVFCQLQSHVKQRPSANGFRDVTTDDEANMLLRFADSEFCSDATGLVSVSMVEGPDYISTIEIFGTDGALMIDHVGALFTASNGKNAWEPVKAAIGETVPGYPDTGFPRGFMELAPRIVEAIRDGRDSIEFAATFDDGLKVQRVQDAARESDRNGCTVKLA